MQACHAALAARAACFHALADPDFFLRQQLVGARIDDGLLRQLLFLEDLVLREVARVTGQVTAVQLDDAGADGIQKGAVVADGDHAATEVLQQLFQPEDGIHVQVVGRLVQQQHVGARDQRLRQRYALARAARQVADDGSTVQTQALQGFFHALFPGPAVQCLDAALQLVQRVRIGGLQIALAQFQHLGQTGTDGFEHGVLRVQHGLLRDIDNAHALLQLQVAIIGMLQPAQDAQQRRLAGTVAANQADALGGLEGKIRAIQQGHMAKSQMRVQQGNQCHGGIMGLVAGRR